MLSEHAAAHRAIKVDEPVDRSMQVLQYATAVVAVIGAALLAILR